MTNPYDNLAALTDLLEEYNVLITGVEHDHDFSDGDGLAEFDITVKIPVYEDAEWVDDYE